MERIQQPTAATTARIRCCCRSGSAERHRFLDGNPEAFAFALDSVATSIIFSSSGAFLVTALIKLAKDAAGCQIEKLPGESKLPDCDETIHGFKPSSMLSSYYTIIGMVAAVSMPVVGASVDTTVHRRGLGRVLAALFVGLLFPTIFVGEENWFEISIVFACMGFVGFFETMALYSYLPELTGDAETLNRITRTISVVAFTGMVLCLAVNVVVTMAIYPPDNKSLDDDIGTARISQSIAFGVGAILFPISWGRLFKARPAARALGENESVLKSSFAQLYRTACDVHCNHPALQWFFVAISLSDAATSALLIVAITFMTDVLEFSGSQNGATIMVFLISSIPGSAISGFWTRRFSPVWSSVMALVVLIANTTLVAAFLKSPDQEIGAYLLAVGWGIGTGWKWTVDRMLYATLLPPHQNSEFSGAFLFFRQCLTWLPPLIITM